MCEGEGDGMGELRGSQLHYHYTTGKKGGGGDDLGVKEDHIRSMKRKFERGDKQRELRDEQMD